MLVDPWSSWGSSASCYSSADMVSKMCLSYSWDQRAGRACFSRGHSRDTSGNTGGPLKANLITDTSHFHHIPSARASHMTWLSPNQGDREGHLASGGRDVKPHSKRQGHGGKRLRCHLPQQVRNTVLELPPLLYDGDKNGACLAGLWDCHED